MKNKVLSLLKTDYAKFGFKRNELESIAEMIANNLADDATDTDVQAAIKLAEPWARMAQQVANRSVTETEKRFKNEEQPTDKTTIPQTADELNALIEQKAKEIAEKAISPIVKAQEQQRLNNLLMSNPKLKSIPSSFIGRYQLEKEDDIEQIMSQIETDYAQLRAEMIKAGSVAEAPKSSNGVTGNIATDDEINDLVAKLS